MYLRRGAREQGDPTIARGYAVTLPLFMSELVRIPPYQQGSPTSKEAAKSVSRGKAARDRSVILAALTLHGSAGLTQKEMSATLGISRQSLTARCAELSGRYEGYAVQIRQTLARRQGCAVWVLA